MGSTILLRLANILLTAIIAHILNPRAFGVFAVALTAYAIVSSVGEFGVSACLIRADLDIESLAPTFVTVSLVTSAVLAGVMAAFAEPIAAALGSAAAAGPVRVMALAVLLGGVFAVPSAQLVRDFKQGKLFLANAVSFVPSTIILVLLAKFGGGALAFAWSRVAGQLIVGCVLMASVSRNYWPGLARGAMSLLWSFGLPLAGANFVNYILLNVDYALIGRLLGAVALGTYVLAFNVASWPSSLLGTMINNVTMPAFSRVRHDAELLKGAIGSSVRAVSLVVMPMCGLTIALARPLILTLYGAKWAASASVLSVLSLYGAISIICLLFGNILSGMGRTKFLLVVQLVWLAALAPAMEIGVRKDGIVGAAFAHIFVIGPIVLPLYLYAMKKTTKVRFAVLIKAALPALLASAAAALAARFIAGQFSNTLAQLIAGLAAGGLVYLVATAPLLMELVSRGKATKAGAGRILGLYSAAARWIRLPIGSRSKQAGDFGGWERGFGLLAQDTAADAPQSAAPALALLLSLARPEPAAPLIARQTAAHVGDPLERRSI
jgi:lipopolysaccharide exporter